jgi:polyhydroxybutyrate depolymerase
MPMISFHGTADPIVKYGGGRNPIGPGEFPSILSWTENWARRNQCDAGPIDSVVAPDVSRREYTHCADSADVLLYTVRGAGHQWPGGKALPQWLAGHATNAVDATSLMWAFFRDHPLRRGTPRT